MIYLCYGMQKSGSTLAYELTRALLEAMGHPNARLSNAVIKEGHAVNFLDGDRMAGFGRETLRRIEAEVPAGRIIAIKTHAPPTDFFRELAAEGRLLGHANFRDPRDAVPSLLDAGSRARSRGQGGFLGITGWTEAVSNYEKHLDNLERWLEVPGFVVTHFEEVAFRSESFLLRVADQLGLVIPADLDLPGLVAEVKARAFTQYNKGLARRHRDDLSINQALYLTHRFGRQIRAYMAEDIDALDLALLDVAGQVAIPDPDAIRAPAEPLTEKAAQAACGNGSGEAPKASERPPRRADPASRRGGGHPGPEPFFRHNMLVHTHLEKTAGTTLVEALKLLLGQDRVHDLRDPRIPRPDALTPAQRSRIRLLSGHFHFGAWERSFARRAAYIGCVRDPYERFCSFHAYVATRPEHPAYPLIGQLPVGEAIECLLRQHHHAVDNYLAGYFGGDGPWLRFGRIRNNLEHRYVAVVPHAQVNRLVVAVAHALDLSPPPGTIRNAQGEYPRGGEGRDMFMRYNSLDYRVFEYVNERYERWLDDLSARLAGISGRMQA